MSASDDGGIPIMPTAGATLPTWVYKLRPLAGVAGALASVAGALITFGKDPVGFIYTVISYYIVGGVLWMGRFLVGIVLAPFDLLIGALEWIQRQLVAAFGALGIDIIAALVEVESAIAGVIATAGPAGPVLAVGAAAVGLVILYRVGEALLVAIPGGDSLLTLVGLR